jgi:hypothetical protein
VASTVQGSSPSIFPHRKPSKADSLRLASDIKPGTFLDQSINLIPYADFINKELILFSMADNVRSIPSVVDGLKPGQRKVIFGCYLKKIKAEIKVSLLLGYGKVIEPKC